MILNFEHLLGDEVRFLPKTQEYIQSNKQELSYYDLSRSERDAVILKVFEKLQSNPSATGDVNKWERCWKDVARNFENSSNTFYLIPPFIQYGQECRVFGDYVKTESPAFEIAVDTVLRTYLFEKYIHKYDMVFEFGAGSCWNLVLLTNMFDVPAVSAEWSRAAVDLANVVGKKLKRQISGHWFDMFNPSGMNMPGGSVVFTHGAMEQMGWGWGPFLQYLLDSNVRLVINVECIYEFYTSTRLIDRLAMEFHLKRNYLSGYYSELKRLESDGKIRILEERHVEFGSLFQDGFSIIVWEPRNV